MGRLLSFGWTLDWCCLQGWGELLDGLIRNWGEGEGWEEGEDGRCHASVKGVKWKKSPCPRCGKGKESKGYGYYILCLEEFGVSEKEWVSGVWDECLFFALNPWNFFTIWINVPRFVQEIHFFGKMTTWKKKKRNLLPKRISKSPIFSPFFSGWKWCITRHGWPQHLVLAILPVMAGKYADRTGIFGDLCLFQRLNEGPGRVLRQGIYRNFPIPVSVYHAVRTRQAAVYLDKMLQTSHTLSGNPLSVTGTPSSSALFHERRPFIYRKRKSCVFLHIKVKTQEGC